jgi:hypothetical protein
VNTSPRCTGGMRSSSKKSISKHMTMFENNMDIDGGLGLFNGSAHPHSHPDTIDLSFLSTDYVEKPYMDGSEGVVFNYIGRKITATFGDSTIMLIDVVVHPFWKISYVSAGRTTEAGRRARSCFSSEYTNIKLPPWMWYEARQTILAYRKRSDLRDLTREST